MVVSLAAGVVAGDSLTTLPTGLPSGARLIHIGFPKTGTTALQSSLAAARQSVVAYGVRYPGKYRYHKDPSIAIVGAQPRIGEATPGLAAWSDLIDEVEKAAADRVLVSSEWLCEADDSAARRIVADLGGGSVHVVATLRPLAKIVPSAWQQYVQNGVRTSYKNWLDGMLRKPPYDYPTKSFWRRHRHDEVLARWASIVGPDRVTVIMTDDDDRLLLLRQFEALLGLPAQLLRPHARDNRSLSRPEVELVRSLNKHYKERQDWPDAFYRDVIRLEVAERLARTDENQGVGPPIRTPQWAADLISEIADQAAGAIRGIGVRIVGDFDSYTEAIVQPPPEDHSVGLPPDVVADVVAAAVNAAREFGRAEERARNRKPAATAPTPSFLRRATRSVRRRIKARSRRRPPAPPRATR